MKIKTASTIVIALLVTGVSACSNSPADNLAARVENAADARADAMENKAEDLQERAQQVRKAGEERADAIDAAGRNVATMSQEHRDAIVANEAAAVR